MPFDDTLLIKYPRTPVVGSAAPAYLLVCFRVLLIQNQIYGIARRSGLGKVVVRDGNPRSRRSQWVARGSVFFFEFLS